MASNGHKLSGRPASLPTAENLRSPEINGFKVPHTPPPRRRQPPSFDNVADKVHAMQGAGGSSSGVLTGRQLPVTFGDDLDYENLGQSSSLHQVPPASDLEPVQPHIQAASERDGNHGMGHSFVFQTRGTPYLSHSMPSTKSRSAKLEGIALVNVIGDAPMSKPNFINQQKFAGKLAESALIDWFESDRCKAVYGENWLNLVSVKTREAHNIVWNLHEEAKAEKDLYVPLLNIFTAIIEEFVEPLLGGDMIRKIHDTHGVSLSHKEGDVYTSPDFVVSATGPSFEIPLDGREYGYSNIITFFDAKLDREMTSATANLQQLSVYARQIFAHQPNRMFVRALLISQKRAQLIQFDRAGAQRSPMINLNEQPQTFIRMVVELCGATSERSIGLDDTLRWEIVNGRKSSGTITFGPQEKIYDLVSPHPFFHSLDIRGRATTMWSATERGTDTVVVIIDSWSSEGRTNGHELLLITEEVKGVGKMVDYHLRDIWTRHFRCSSTIRLFSDRQASRMLMEPHGKHINKFTDALELLEAVYDVLSAHFRVYRLNILHRNVSNETVLLGSIDAEPGWRGVLVDFGLALNFDPENGDCYIAKEGRVGNRFFQSLTILRFLTELSVGEAPAHDHLDDLESFFNLICYLFFGFHPNGDEREKTDKAMAVIRGWDSVKADDAIAFKSLIFNPTLGHKESAIGIVYDSWGPACGDLFEAFLEWVYGIQQEKAAILRAHQRKQREAERERERQKKQDGKEKDKGAPTQIEIVMQEGGIQDIDENPFADASRIGNSTNLNTSGAAPAKPKGKIALKKGIFAPLMEGNLTSHHFDTVLNFFLIAIEKIKLAPDENGPPPALPPPPAPPKASKPKRKRGKGPNDMDVDEADAPDTKRISRTDPA